MPDPLHLELLQNPLALAHRFRLEHPGLNPGRHLLDDFPRFVARVMHRFENEFLAHRLLRVSAHPISPASLYSVKYIDDHSESPFPRLEADVNGRFPCGILVIFYAGSASVRIDWTCAVQ
jgi:hypothetical protein